MPRLVEIIPPLMTNDTNTSKVDVTIPSSHIDLFKKKLGLGSAPFFMRPMPPKPISPTPSPSESPKPSP